MSAISSKNDLLRALGLLRETGSDTDEVKKQRKMQNAANAIRSATMSEEEDEGGKDEAKPEPQSEPKKSDDKPKEKPKDLPGAKELKDTPPKIPSVITGLTIIDKINKIRAGASMKGDKVMKSVDSYVTSLPSAQAQDLYTYLDALARIILAGMDSSEVPVPSQAKGDKAVEPKSTRPAVVKGKQAKNNTSDDEVPIVTLAEGVKRRLKEIDVPVRNGKLVPFGSRSHIADLESRIHDLERIRSYQEPGSDSRHVMGLAIKALKSQLKAAEKANGFGNPRVQAVPPIVEKDK